MPAAHVLRRPHPDPVAAGDLQPSVPPRRRQPRLLVAVDGSGASQRQLVWALREAARRDATVLAVMVTDPEDPAEARGTARTTLEAQVLVAEEAADVHGRSRVALLDPTVLEVLTGTAGGAELVVVGPHRKTVLRPAVPRPPARRPIARCT